MYQKYPAPHVQCTRARAGEDLPAAEEPQQLHVETSAQPAVKSKQECCDANGYGCTEGRQSVEELCVE